MTPADLAMHDGYFVVIETENSWYLGTLDVDSRNGTVTVYTGYTGRPPVIRFDEVQDVVRADRHPAVAAA